MRIEFIDPRNQRSVSSLRLQREVTPQSMFQFHRSTLSDDLVTESFKTIRNVFSTSQDLGVPLPYSSLRKAVNVTYEFPELLFCRPSRRCDLD